MAGKLKALVVAGVVAIGGLMASSPARAQQFLPPNGNPGPFPPRACGHVGPCPCPRPWSPGHGWGSGHGYGYGYGWGYGHGGFHGGFHGGPRGGHR
jgi:hypothetical protein